MVSLKNFHLLSIVVVLAISAQSSMASNRAVKGAYWPSWQVETFPPAAIDTRLFTHIYYAFLSPSNVTFKFEISDSNALLLHNFTTTLRQKNPPVKTLVSFGGGNSDFAAMATNAHNRKIFINSSIELARNFGFDGLDLDWEFPQNPKQMEDMGQLFKEWRSAIKEEANSMHRSPLLLTAAVYFNNEFLWANNYRQYPAASLQRNLDWINAMCYDYHGSWDTSATGAHAALYDPKSNISTSYGLTSWIKAGMHPNMIVMGLPLYGKTWQLKDPNVHGVGAPAVAVGPGSPGDIGVLIYSEVVKFNRENGATVVYDEATVSTYSYAGSSWIGYDDTKSVTAKIRFAQARGLRGYFFWALSYDNDWKISTQASKAWIKTN